MDDPLPELAVNEVHEAQAPVGAGSCAVDLAAPGSPTAEISAAHAERSAPAAGQPQASSGIFAAFMSGAIAPMIAIIAWFVPGLGHVLLRRWQRAVAFFVAVGGLAVTGYLMRGNVFAPHSQDPFGTLGFIADASSGIFYLFAHLLEKGGPDVARAMGDYGTRFIAGAGIVNLLGVCDAYEVARGRKY